MPDFGLFLGMVQEKFIISKKLNYEIDTLFFSRSFNVNQFIIFCKKSIASQQDYIVACVILEGATESVF